MAFCQQCAKEDECELVYDKVEEYIDHLAAAAKEDKEKDKTLELDRMMQMDSPWTARVPKPLGSDAVREEAK